MVKKRNELFEGLWDKSWAYIKTVVDVVREPVLILDKGLKVMAANEAFYLMFKVDPKTTENKVVYELGNGQWDIPALRKLLEDILPQHTFFKGFEVSHEFPVIGHKVMILNARQIHIEGDSTEIFPQIILLAMEDITEIISVANKLAEHTNQFESRMTDRTRKIELHMSALGVEINRLKKKPLKAK